MRVGVGWGGSWVLGSVRVILGLVLLGLLHFCIFVLCIFILVICVTI